MDRGRRETGDGVDRPAQLALALAGEWRRLDRVATAVALVMSPVSFALLYGPAELGLVDAVLHPERAPAAIASLEHRLELLEELGVELVAGSAIHLGTFEDLAVNEPGCHVRARAYLVEILGDPTPRAEIAELAWVPLGGPLPVKVAPLSSKHILPAAASSLAIWRS